MPGKRVSDRELDAMLRAAAGGWRCKHQPRLPRRVAVDADTLFDLLKELKQRRALARAAAAEPKGEPLCPAPE